MTEQHPITPPPELVGEWLCSEDYLSDASTFSSMTITSSRLQNVATQAARWGADQELQACCEWLDRNNQWARCDIDELHEGRRPKPQSLKEQALSALAEADGADYPVVCTTLTADQHALIRRALEQLDD